MIIIGILAAIAIPVFLTQRATAHDTSTKADVSNLGKEIATLFVDGNGATAIDFDVQPGRAVISDGASTTVLNLTNGTAKPTAGASRDLNDPNGWCVSLTDPQGKVKQYNYSAAAGLDTGPC
jgi:type II secretory pathway pseudopilin PulG